MDKTSSRESKNVGGGEETGGGFSCPPVSFSVMSNPALLGRHETKTKLLFQGPEPKLQSTMGWEAEKQDPRNTIIK